MAKSKPQPQSPLVHIKGGFVITTFVRLYKAKSAVPVTDAQAQAVLAELVRAGKVTEGPRVGLYPGLQSYRFAD